MTVHAVDRGRGLSPRQRRIVQAQFTLGDIVDAVMHFAADSREAAEVIDDLFETGHIRAILRWAADATTDDDLFDLLKGMNPDGDKDPIDGVLEDRLLKRDGV